MFCSAIFFLYFLDSDFILLRLIFCLDFFYWSHHLIIVFDFAFICSHIYFIVVLFSSVFLVSLFFQAVFMISFFAVIFLLVAVLFIVISVYSIFSCHLFYWFYQQVVFYQAGYFVGLSYGVSVELFVVLFSIFVVFEVGVYFAFLSLPQYYTYDTTLLYTDTTFIISTNIDRTTNQLIFQPIKQINQIICPCNIPDQLIYFT